MNKNEFLNISLNEKRKNFQKERVDNLRKNNISDLERDITIEKNSNKDVNSQLKQDNNFVNNNINQTLEKYRKEIIGDTKEEPIVPTTAKLNSQKKENPNYQDNSIILKQAYNEKLKKNTNETKDLLTNKNNNQ